MKHHSTGDFDMPDTYYWTLDTAQYVSPPSSLKFVLPGAPTERFAALLKSPVRIREGALVFNIRIGSPIARALVFCRSSQPVGTSSPNSAYWLYTMGGDHYLFWADSSGNNTSIGSWALYPTVTDTWAKYRLTWWEGLDLHNVAATVFRLEYWDGSAWVSCGDDLYDTNRRNQASAIQRAGVGAYTWEAGGKCWHDDDEFWSK